jgi:hypothetical protein
MAQIFRIHTQGGANTVNHWGASYKIGTQAIGSIQDPNGASAKKEITSIPSPFARMDLVKTAFGEVVKSNNLDGTNIYHKMVSDCLDIGQIFFNFDKYSNFIEIIEWNRHNDLSNLNNSSIQGHKQLADTYDLYLKQDAKTYNFGQLQSIFILKCIDPSALAGNKFIGATSPATLFFSSANDLTYVSNLIDFGGDQPFDGNYTPLYKRDIEYQKFWYLLRMHEPNFAQLFPEVDDYLTGCYNALQPNQRAIINSLSPTDFQNLTDISVGGAGNLVNVLNIPIKQKTKNTVNIQTSSDFVINSPHTVNGVIPLVLPVDTFSRSLNYVTAVWNPNTPVPYLEKNALHQRTLPADGSRYPYLTISDFLEDTIIQLPFAINTDAFFDSNCGGKGYLLPLKNQFFDFFTVEQLKQTLPNGKKMFELQSNAGGVKVILRIPIKNNKSIEYSRLYFSGNQPDIDNNKGAVIQKDFDLALFPNIKFNNEADAYYRLGLISTFEESDNNKMCCFGNGNRQINCESTVRNPRNTNYSKCRHYCLEKTNFDYLQITCNGIASGGILIPAFNHKSDGTKQVTFAVDFGTTNTHIEYSIDGKPSQALNITAEDKQINLLSNEALRTKSYALIFDSDILPITVSRGEAFSFPMRTALSEASDINWNSAVFAMAHANIPFIYEKRPTYDYNKVTPNLKWSNDMDNMKRVKAYIESLFLILRNKVILSDGNLSATKIVWFYPISMTRKRYNDFKIEWENAYKKYFGNNTGNIIPMTESVGPYEFYKNAENSTSDMVTVDIGGGTTDIVIAQMGEVKFITSFRFAADSIFGDGYATNVHGQRQNGIIRQFKTGISDVLKANEMDELLHVFSEMENKNISAEIASFLFSLSSNKDLLDKHIAENVDFNRLLQADGSQKILFLFFYVAIIYHLAHILKAKHLPVPRHITFSGNGSKVIRILSTDTGTLEQFTKKIFEKILGTSVLGKLTIIHNAENPKEATCKGGITNNPEPEDYGSIANKKVILKGSDNQSFISNEKYSNIDSSDIVQTTNTAKQFIQFTLDLNNDFSFKNNFGVETSSFDIAKSECLKNNDLETYTSKGMEQKLKEVSKDDVIEETMFFYPLVGMINELSNVIFENNKKNN